MISDEFLAAIPKTDLHVHLDGSVRIGTLIELAQEQGKRNLCSSLPLLTPLLHNMNGDRNMDAII
jgi:adenosine deaminase